MKEYKKFNVIYLTIIGLFLTFLLINYIFLVRVNETLTIEDIVDLQQKNNAIYGSAVNQRFYPYKLELYKNKNPEVITLGSSKVMQFREEFFNTSFVNCGGAMRSIQQGEVFLEDLFKYKKPKLIIMGVDFWWFNPRYHQDLIGRVSKTTIPDIKLMMTPYKWIKKKKITPKEAWEMFVNPNSKNKYTDYNNIGMMAYKDSDGFRKDGSYLYGSIFSGLSLDDVQFKTTSKLIERGKKRFRYSEEISEEQKKDFKRVIELCKKNNVDLIVYIPPLPNITNEKIASKGKKYAYIKQFKDFITSLSVENYDFSELKSISSNDCECVDGFHCGTVSDAKILKTIIKKNPKSKLKKYLNEEKIQYTINNFEGKALAKFSPEEIIINEKDFLGLGCKK